MPPARETPPPGPTPGAEPSSLRHERVPGVTWRHEVLFDRPGAGPADQVEHAARLVIGAAGTPAAERLLTDDGSRRLVVLVEVAGGVAQRRIGLGHRRAVLREDGASKRIGRGAVHDGECFL